MGLILLMFALLKDFYIKCLFFSGLYIIFYLIVTTSFAGISVPYNALIADKSHPTQRGNYKSF